MKYFWLTIMLVLLEIEILLVSIKKSLYQCNPLYTRRGSWHGLLYVYTGYYLHVIEACIKVTIAMFYFYDSKNPSDVMKNIFNSNFIYSS